MFDRLSGTTQRVLVLAEEESRRQGHRQIGTEHLLLGILADGTSPAARTLRLSGATLDASRSKVEEAVGVSAAETGTASLPFSDRAKRALERANRVSLRRRDEYLDTEHLLVSVLEIEGRAGQILRGLGVDPVGLRDRVDSLIEERPVAERPVAGVATSELPTEPGRPRCGGCGSALDTSLSHRVMASRGSGEDVRDFVIAYCSVCGRVFGAATTGQVAGAGGAP